MKFGETRLALFLLLLPMVLQSGCGGPTQGQRLPDGMVWEYGWVDPEVVYSDALLTVIRASRLDSFPAAAPEDSLQQDFSLALQVTTPVCPVSINLYDGTGKLVQPLLVQRLTAGFYKVSVTRSGLLQRGFFPGDYIIGADHCGQRSQMEFLLY